MALITITGSISYDAAHEETKLGGLVTGEAIVAGHACVIKSDGKVYKAGTAVVTGTMSVGFDGFAMRNYGSGDPITLIGDGNIIMLDANAGLTAGADYWLSATAGVLSDAKIAGVDTPVARGFSTSAIRVVR